MAIDRRVEPAAEPFTQYSVASRALYWIDSQYRKYDWRWNRTTGGLLSKLAFCPRAFRNHAPVGLLVFLLLLIFLALGPSLRVYWLFALLAYGASLVVLAVLSAAGDQWQWSPFRAQYLTVAVLCVFLYFLPARHSDSIAREADRTLYPHLLLPFALVVFTASATARWGARRLLRGLFCRFAAPHEPHALLQQTELFVVPDRHPSVKTGSLALALLTVPLRYPIELVFLPALYIDLFGSGTIIHWALIVLIAVVIAVVLALADVYQRLEMIRAALRRCLLYGGLWLTSLAIIGLAVAWVTEFGYIRTVMEGDRLLVLQYIAAAYLLFWVHEYWVNRTISEELLRHLVDPQRGAFDSASIPYPYTPADNERDPTRPQVHSEDRRVQIQGASLFVVVGRRLEDAAGRRGGTEVWQTYERTGLFMKLAESIPDEERRNQVLILVGELRRRLQAYFTILNAAILAVVVVSIIYVEQAARQHAATAKAVRSQDDKLLNPQQLVLATTSAASSGKPVEKTGQASRPRIILIAASGGGTRAALYTSSVLHGLSRIHALNDVRIVSGVSGGGVALAYFAAHRDKLRTGDADAWKRFHDAMSAPFIEDVLRGAAESRMARGTPLGTLLAESFSRQFWGVTELDKTPGIGPAAGDVGIILNSTLCGQFPPDFGSLTTAERDLRFLAGYSTGRSAGSRLVFCNMDCRPAFQRNQLDDPTLGDLPYVVIDDPALPLTVAAALNANFPPVFPNAAVDVDDAEKKTFQRYWVTDGGAEENRGLVSLLLVLRQALQVKEGAPATVLPDIHILVAEASAGSVDYSHDRGIGAASSASSALAQGLAQELAADVRRLYKALPDAGDRKSPARIGIHFLPMPSTLRIGGMGTHWMLPRWVRLRKTGLPPEITDEGKWITRDEIRQVIEQLHDPAFQGSKTAGLRPAVKDVWTWIENDPILKHRETWNTIQTTLQEQSK